MGHLSLIDLHKQGVHERRLFNKSEVADRCGSELFQVYRRAWIHEKEKKLEARPVKPEIWRSQCMEVK